MAPGSIKIMLNKPYYVAGERVEGNVDIHLAQPVQAHFIKIKWTGYERTLIEQTEMKPNARGELEAKTVQHRDERKFFKQEYVLYQINQVMPAGNYNYPFAYQLPAGLPGIFFDSRSNWGGDKVKGGIIYKVKVFLDVVGKDLKESLRFIVAESNCKAPQPRHDHKEKGFLLAKGKLHFDFWMEQDVVCPGQSLPIKVLVKNESSKKVDKIKVKLMRDLKIKAKGLVRNVTETLACEKYDGVPEKTTEERVIPYVVPASVYPSAHGQLIECRYHLDIECDIPMAIDLEHHVPITLALMPSAPMQLNMFATYTPKSW